MKRALLGVVIFLLAGATAGSQAPASAGDALIARAKSLELNTPYVPPPGDPLDHHTSGFAKIMCSAVFITGLDADFAAEVPSEQLFQVVSITAHDYRRP